MQTGAVPPSSSPPTQEPSSLKRSSCPVKSPNHPIRSPSSLPPSSTAPPQTRPPSTFSKLNPLNYMPTLSNQREHADQSVALPLSRETSSIPRGDADTNWEYPSPQQMYNAMLRKGYTDTPADAVESMVAVHNFLNEGAWNEIVAWESIFGKGFAHGWQQCLKGEEGISMERARAEMRRQRKQELGYETGSTAEEEGPRLVRFMGRPNDRTPKASIQQALGWVFPETYGSEPPFDRHDWYVARPTPTGTKEVRYVIDYYAGGIEPTGEPVFYLDIRPALDTPSAAIERAMRWGGDVWHRASGASVREQQQQKARR